MKISRRVLYRTIAVIALCNVLIWSVVCFEELYKNRIMPGTHFAGLSIGGKTVEQASQNIIDAQTKLLNQPITVTADDINVSTTAESLGASIDAIALNNTLTERTKPSYFFKHLIGHANAANPNDQPTIRFANSPLETFISDLKQKVDREPQNAGLTYKDNQIQETDPITGRAVIKETAKSAIQTAFAQEIPSTITIPLDTKAPALTTSSQMSDAKTKLTTLLAHPLILTANNQSVTLSPNDVFNLLTFGVNDNKLAYTVDQAKTNKVIDDFAKKVYVAPVTKQLAANGDVITEGKDGIGLDKLDAFKVLSQTVVNPTSSSVSIATNSIPRATHTDSGDFYQLGRTDGKYIEVSLSKQRMALVDGNNLVKIYAVSTGKWSTPTPIGEFYVHNHISTARSSLFPDLLMDDWMGITDDGAYGIHRLPRYADGSWIEDPNHIGTPVSHGCIRLAPGDSSDVYNWASNGTKVYIHN